MIDIQGTDGDLHTLCEPSNGHGISIINTRHNRDNIINEYGRLLINLCKQTEMKIMNGRIVNCKLTSNYTCYTANGFSAVDYLLCRLESVKYISELNIHAKRPESDHCPIAFSLNLQHVLLDKDKETNPVESNETPLYKWDILKVKMYHEHLQGSSCKYHFDKIINDVVDENITISELCENFYNYLNNAIQSTFDKKKLKKNKFPRNKWFNDQCKNAKKRLHDYSKTFDITARTHSEQYRLLEKEYVRIIQKSK